MEYQNILTAYNGQKQHPVRHLFLVFSLLEPLCPCPFYVNLESGGEIDSMFCSGLILKAPADNVFLSTVWQLGIF